MAMGHLELLQEAKAEIDAVGANASVLGKDDRVQSGRALQARTQSGIAELGGLFDNLRLWSHEIYKHIWYAVKQFWTAETWVRVTDDERNIRFVGLNQMVMTPMGPQVQNDVSRMCMDIVIEDAPDVATIQAEQFDLLVQMYQANPEGPITAEDVIEASQLRNKKQILERQKQRQQPNPQMEQIQQAGIQLEMADKQSQIQKNQASAAQSFATAEKTRVETALLPAKAAQEQQQAQIQQQNTQDRFALDVRKQNDSAELGRMKAQPPTSYQ